MGAATEAALGSDLERLTHLDFEFEAECEVPARSAQIGGGMPKCPGRPASWVAWKDSCCTATPRYLLMCDQCKSTYQAWMATAAFINCGDCGQESGYVLFTPLNTKA